MESAVEKKKQNAGMAAACGKGKRDVAAAFRRYVLLGAAKQPRALRIAFIRSLGLSDADTRELCAVDATLRLLLCFGRKDCYRAVRALWMCPADVAAPTVLGFAASQNLSPRTVYRYLALVRLCFEQLV